MSEIVKPKINNALILAEALKCLANALWLEAENGTVETGWQRFKNIYGDRAKWNDPPLVAGLPVSLRLRHTQDPSGDVYVFSLEIGKLGASESRFDVEQRNLVYEGEFSVPSVSYPVVLPWE